MSGERRWNFVEEQWMSRAIEVLNTARKIHRGIHDYPGSILTSLDGAWGAVQSPIGDFDAAGQRAFVDGLLPLICRANDVDYDATGNGDGRSLQVWRALQESKAGSFDEGDAVFSRTLDMAYAELERTAGPADRHFFDACRLNPDAPRGLREEVAMKNLSTLQAHLAREGVTRADVTMLGFDGKCDFGRVGFSSEPREKAPVEGFRICRETPEGWIQEELEPLPLPSAAARVAIHLADMAYDNWADDGATIRTAIRPDSVEAGVRWTEVIEGSETGYRVDSSAGRLWHDEDGPEPEGMEP